MPVFTPFAPPRSLCIGPYTLPHAVLAAPMASVTDQPFRQLCRRFGASYAVAEMVAARPDLRRSLKSRLRSHWAGEAAPVAVQIVGANAPDMAEAAAWAIDQGAHVIDINMGCPAKKVCSQWSGSALMQNEALALQIIEAVVAACAPHGVPVTLKMRTGWSAAHRNAPALARAAEGAGVQMIVIHGRTREQLYKGQAEYDTIAAVKAAVRLAVVANGDIDSPAKAAAVLAVTDADGVMLGRAAWRAPWLIGQTAHFLRTGHELAQPLTLHVRAALLDHLQAHYGLYGHEAGVRSARKHLQRMLGGLPGAAPLLQTLMAQTEARLQWQAVDEFLLRLAERHERLPRPALAPASAAAAD